MWSNDKCNHPGDCAVLAGDCAVLPSDGAMLPGDCAVLPGDCAMLLGDCAMLPRPRRRTQGTGATIRQGLTQDVAVVGPWRNGTITTATPTTTTTATTTCYY